MTDRSIDRARWLTLAALVLSVLAVGLDTTVLSVALPTLSTDLRASTGQLQWFIDSFNLVLAAAVLPAGLLGDRFGRKRLILIALLIFGAGSIWCAYAGSATGLIEARVLLALGASVLMTVPASVLPVIFPAEELGKAVTVWATALFVSFPLGPIVGGLLLNNFWWGSVFLINVPVVLVALVAIQWLMPESRSPHRVRFEPVALLLAIGSLVAVTYGVIEVGDRGWGDRRSWAWLLLAAVLLIAFLGRQRRQQARVIDGESLLIDLRIFRSAGYTWGIVLAVAATFAMFGLLFAGPQYFQSVLGYDALGTGLRQLPMIGGLVVGGRLAGPVLARTGARVAVGIGFALMTIALLLGATTSISSGFAVSALWMAIFGFGIGFSLPTAMGAAISAIPPERSGMGSGLLMSLRMAAGAIGVAVLGSVVNSGYRGHLQLEGLPGTAAQAVRDGVGPGVRVANALGDPGLLRGVESAFIHGMDLMYVVSAGICLIGGALGLAFLPDRSDGPDRPDRADHGEPVGLPDPGDGESEHDVARTR